MQYTLIASTLVAAVIATNHEAPAYPPAAQAAWPSAAAPEAAYPSAAYGEGAYPPAAPAEAAWPTPAAPEHAAWPSAAAGSETVHIVDVGTANGSLVFKPENTIAKTGDLVQFQFWPKNHSVVQAAFASPCMPLQQVQPNVTDAFFSGFMPTTRQTKEEDALTYTIRVKDETKPMWFYCSQAKHCQNGMVGAINSPEIEGRSVAAFKQQASAAAENLSPGQIPSAQDGAAAPSAAPPAGGAPAPTTLQTAAGTGVAGAQSTETPVAASSGSILDATRGGIIGVAIAGLIFLAL